MLERDARKLAEAAASAGVPGVTVVPEGDGGA